MTVATRFHVVGHEGLQRLGRGVGQDGIRHRPSPFGPRISTAIPVRTFLPLARPPRSSGSCPPMKVSSTSTVPVSCSRSGRTRTVRSR